MGDTSCKTGRIFGEQDLQDNGFQPVLRLGAGLLSRYFYLSHNNPCFQCDITVTNFLVLHAYEIRFHDAIGQSTVHMYSYAKILKHG